MATRYWVGGSAAWDDANVWSTTSGGAGGASNPTSTDDVVFDQAGPYTISSASTPPAQCRNLTVSGANVTLNLTFFCYGDFTTLASTVIGSSSGGYVVAFNGSGTITANGATWRNEVYFGYSASVTYSLGSALTTTSYCTLNYGSLTTNNYSLTVSAFDARGSSAKTFALGTSTLTVTGNGTACMLNSTGGLTFSYSTGAAITFTGATITFNGGGKSLPPVNFNNTGAVEVQNSNTFADIRSSYVGAKTFSFTSGQTNTFIAFNLRGTSGNLYTITATSTSQTTFTKSGAWYMGANSTNSGNNTGLTFSGGSGIDYLNVSYINGVSAGGQGSFFALLS